MHRGTRTFKHRLSLNVLKSEYMLIGSKVRINELTSYPKIFIGGHRLIKASSCNKIPGALMKIYHGKNT